MTTTAKDATLIVVAFRTTSLDLSWVPPGARVIVVHNDERLGEDAVHHSNVGHLHSDGNVGFGRAVNAALRTVSSSRVVLGNPDVQASREHWDALTDAAPNEIVVVPLADGAGRPTSVVSRYPTPISLLLSAYRAGRLAPRGGRLRRAASLLLGRWGRDHAASLRATSGKWPLRQHWASGALVSFDAARLRAVGGFDDAYFLYYEDVDLCRRLADRFDDMQVRMAPTAPAVHAVGGSATGALRTATERRRFESAMRYCMSQQGPLWRACALAMRPGLRSG